MMSFSRVRRTLSARSRASSIAKGRDDLVARSCQLACRSGLDPIAQRLRFASQLLRRRNDRLPICHAFDGQLLKRRRVCLFGYFSHCLPLQNNVDVVSHLEDEIPGEAQFEEIKIVDLGKQDREVSRIKLVADLPVMKAMPTQCAINTGSIAARSTVCVTPPSRISR